MRKICFSLIFLILFLNLSAQISVKSFRVLPTDQTARITNPVVDQNGEKCAIIKITATIQGLLFEGGMLGIMKREWKNGEYWVYIPHGAKKITIKHDQLGVLRNYIYPEAIKEATVYEMVLTTAKVSTIVEEVEIPTQWVMITSSPDGANVYINEQHKGMCPFQMEMEEGHYTYRIEMPLYHPEAGAFYLSEAEGKKRIESNLKPNFGYANITTSPESGANVYVDGQPLSQQTPIKTDRLKSGSHTIRVEKVMYHPRNLEITIEDNQTTPVDIVLKPTFGGLNISTEPEQGAVVLLDGNPTGKTSPCTLERLSSGEHLIRVQKEWYQPQSKRVSLEEGENTSLNIVLEPTFGTLTITASDEAAIFIDGEQKGMGSWSGRLIAGYHSIEARKDKYHTATEKTEIILGQEHTLSLYPTPMLGILKVVSTPFDATITLNGKEYGSTPNTIKDLLIGEYSLTLSKTGYGTITKTITIKENETIEINETLPAGREITISSTPVGAHLSIDGKYAGITPLTITLSFGSHSLKLINGKKEVNEEISISQSGKASFSYDVSELGDFSENINGVSIDMVAVKGGCFNMGSNDGDSDEKPVHQVCVDDFYIGKYEVTQKQWKEIMGNYPSKFKCDDCPVEQVSWDDVQDFIRKLNSKTGNNYRLPTEAEWEYAARGGDQSRGYIYSGSNTIGDVAWYNGNSGSKTHAAGTKKANELGIYDMSGNVWEWCSDWYGADYYGKSPTNNPAGPTTGSYRVLRGGSWDLIATYCRMAIRGWRRPGGNDKILGFRLALSLE